MKSQSYVSVSLPWNDAQLKMFNIDNFDWLSFLSTQASTKRSFATYHPMKERWSNVWIKFTDHNFIHLNLNGTVFMFFPVSFVYYLDEKWATMVFWSSWKSRFFMFHTYIQSSFCAKKICGLRIMIRQLHDW